jgi:hypothetical protein
MQTTQITVGSKTFNCSIGPGAKLNGNGLVLLACRTSTIFWPSSWPWPRTTSPTDALPRAGCEEFISRASDFAGGEEITSEQLTATFDYLEELSSECQGPLWEDLADAMSNG